MKLIPILIVALSSFAGSAIASDRLLPNQSISNNGLITSPNGKYSLIMQSDGSLVMYRADGSVRYRMAKYGKIAIMQTDCNFVEYSSATPDTSSAIWSSGTYNQCPALGSLVIHDDGDLSIDWANPEFGMAGSVWGIGADPTPVASVQYPMQQTLPSAPAPSVKPYIYDVDNTNSLPGNPGRY